MSARTILVMVRKDILDSIKNLYIVSALVMPLVASLLLRLMMPNNNFTIVVYDPGQSGLITGLHNLPQINLLEVNSAEAVPLEVEKQSAVGGLVLPMGFDAAVFANQHPEVTAYLNKKGSALQQASFQQILDRQIVAFVNQPAPVRLAWVNLAEQKAIEQNSLSVNQLALLVLLIMTMCLTGVLVVPLLLVEEKENHTLEFLRLAPASLNEVIIAKALTGLVYSGLTVFILLAFNYRQVGNWPITLLVMFVGMCLVVLIGLLMGAFSQNTMQVNTWASFVAVVLMLPSFFGGVMSLPPLFETVLRLIPTYYLIEALRVALTNKGLTEMWGPMAVLMAIVVVTFSAVVWTLKRERI
jgi:ABC-type multidrug transport system permease subunit